MPKTTTREGRKPLTGAQQELALKYLPLARSLAKPFKTSWPGSRDDFESAACLALVEAAEAFDPGRNVKFATFSRHRIWGALRDVQRGLVPFGWRCDAKHAPNVGPLPRDPERQGRVVGAEPDGPVGHEIEAIEAVESLLKRLPARHAAACRQIYLHGKSQHEAARELGCSQSRLSYMHRESMTILDGSWDARVRGGDGSSC